MCASAREPSVPPRTDWKEDKVRLTFATLRNFAEIWDEILTNRWEIFRKSENTYHFWQ